MDRDAVDVLLDQWAREKPELDVSAMGVIGRAIRANSVLTRGISRVFEERGMSLGEFDLMATILRSGPPYALTVGALRGFTMVSGGAVTNRLDRLSAKGWVSRESLPGDRRSRVVRLTDEGRRVVEDTLLAHVDNEAELISGLDPDEQAALGNLLRKLLVAHGDVPGSPHAFDDR